MLADRTAVLIQVLSDGGRTVDPSTVLLPEDLRRLLRAMGIWGIIEIGPEAIFRLEEKCPTQEP